MQQQTSIADRAYANDALDTTTEVASGLIVDLLHPTAAMIAVDDIAHHLARINRFNGATSGCQGLSVAQHSVWVATVLRETTVDPVMGLHGLLHDASEAYLGDICMPLKRIPAFARAYEPLEQRMQAVIYEALGIPRAPDDVHAKLKQCDLLSLWHEVSTRLPSQGSGPQWSRLRSLAAEPTTESFTQAVAEAHRVAGPHLNMTPEYAQARWTLTYKRYQREIAESKAKAVAQV